ncbi:MAG: hypothetical protein O7G85_06225 [Planctomycetota bacterium]|nr:hypothetical protein [Planctomycetota bacterium]
MTSNAMARIASRVAMDMIRKLDMKTGMQMKTRQAKKLRVARIRCAMIAGVLIAIGGCSTNSKGLSINSNETQMPQVTSASNRKTAWPSYTTHPSLERWKRQTRQRMLIQTLGWSEPDDVVRLAFLAGRQFWSILEGIHATQSDKIALEKWGRLDPTPIHVMAMEAKSIVMLDIRKLLDLKQAPDSMQAMTPTLVAPPLKITASVRPGSQGRIDDAAIDAGMQIAGITMFGFILMVPALCNFWASWQSRPARVVLTPTWHMISRARSNSVISHIANSAVPIWRHPGSRMFSDLREVASFPSD